MRILKPLILIFLLSLLFVGNIGVKVFTHHCKEDGDMVSVFYSKANEHCGDEIENLPECCHSSDSNSTETSFEKEDCCSDEINYYQLNTQYAQDEQIPDIEIQAFVSSKALALPNHTVLFDYYTSNYVQPPPLSSRDRLNLYQVWII